VKERKKGQHRGQLTNERDALFLSEGSVVQVISLSLSSSHTLMEGEDPERMMLNT